MKEKIIQKAKAYLVHICIFLSILCVFLLVFLLVPKEQEEEKPVFETEEKEEEKEEYFIDVKGAVQKEGVYQLSKNARIKDAIDKAGGLLENANTKYINLGKKITDEMVLIIYTNEEIQKVIEGSSIISIEKNCTCPTITNDGCLEKEKTVTNKKEKEDGSIININTATKEQLQTLPGIGSSKALLIMTYREKTPFQKIEDIKNIKGIGDSIFDKIKDRITV